MTDDTFSPEILSKDMLNVTEAAVHQVLHLATIKPKPTYNLKRFERSRFDLSFLDVEEA